MKIALFFSLGLTAFFLIPAMAAPVSAPTPATSPTAAPASAPAPATWTTTDGKVYQNVTVVKTEPDAVTITDHDGGARVPLANLPPDLQKHFNYDPAKAKAAADARAQDDAKNAKALQAEMDQAQIQKRAAMIATDPRGPFPTVPARASAYTPAPDVATADTSTPAAVDSATTTTNVASDPLADGPSGPTHHSMDDLVDINSRLKDDHPSPNRHTISSLLLASSYLMPDPLDPNHHSTDELVKSASDMTPPQTDTGNRHSTDSLFGNDPLQHP
jgi:hypothetical protein